MIWDSPHQHIITPASEKYKVLELVSTQSLPIQMHLKNPAIQSLFKMTPYYRKAPKIIQDAILGLESLDIEADFVIDMVRK